MIVNVKEIQNIIHAMPIGKAPGYDSVNNKHFKYANEKLHVLMSLLNNSMLIVPLLLKNSLSDGVASQNLLPFQTVLSRMESFLHISTYE